MMLSDIAIKRPVFTWVLSLLLIIFGTLSFFKLPLREYPNIDAPIVTIQVSYPGAAAAIIESQITQIIEERIAGIAGINNIASSSEDGRARITVEFNLNRDIDAATNDIRDRVARVADDLPDQAEPPEISKEDGSDQVIIWYSLVSSQLSVPELTDYAERFLVDRFSIIDGVSRVRIGGGQSYALRVWVDRNQMAARGLGINDIENALRRENVEFPAGVMESDTRIFSLRLQRSFQRPEDFNQLVIGRGSDNQLVRLGDVARIEKSVVEERSFFRGNGEPQIGLGIVQQSTANTIEVAEAAANLVERLNPTLPHGMEIVPSFDGSVFIKAAIVEVYSTLIMTILLVIAVIYVFLRDWRATIVPAIAVPVSVIGTFTILYLLGYSINMLTMLALVLGIGIVVDDAIVVLENIVRRMHEYKESALKAALLGTRQVFFAVVATTLVLMAVFIPIVFLEGTLGRLFREFAITLAAAVGFSSLVALSLSAMLASKILRPTAISNPEQTQKNQQNWLHSYYQLCLPRLLRHAKLIMLLAFLLLAGISFLLRQLPQEYAPREDRGAFFINVTGPEGASFSYMQPIMAEIEKRLMPLVEKGEVRRLIVRAPGGFGSANAFNSGLVIATLMPWGERRPADAMIAEIRKKLSDIAGVRIAVIMRQGISSGNNKPVQFVIGGGNYEELAKWRDQFIAALNSDNPGLSDIDWDYKETKPQFDVTIDYDRAKQLGISPSDIGRAMETMLAGRRVGTYNDKGQEYDVILEGLRELQRNPQDIANIFIRGNEQSGLIPLANLVVFSESATSRSLNRFNRSRAITIDANLTDNLSLGDALQHLREIAKKTLPPEATIDYKGQSRDFATASLSMIFVFLLGISIVYLLLAAQFESWSSPLVIILGVPLAMAGGIIGLYLAGGSLNIYSQIGLLVLIGIAAKNGILIVEFANQLRDEGQEFTNAIINASLTRLRPILMTSLTTAAGAVPLILASGAGAESRIIIGIVLFAGIIAATIFTLIIIPAGYYLLARRTTLPGDIDRRLQREMS